jgi:nitrous oxidase accessory protein NosD
LIKIVALLTSEQAINEKILSFNYEDYTAEIKTVDAQDSHEKGVIVLVTGCLTGSDNLRRKFTQTFFLAPQDKGYFVLNDVFRYVEENELLQTNSVSVNGINKNVATASQSAQIVGNAFVEQYYQILHLSPGLMNRYYQDSSLLSRPDANGNMETVTTMQVSPFFFLTICPAFMYVCH